jgi:diguanylate cyclase (GGDEF)-like protein
VERQHSPTGARWLEVQFVISGLFAPVRVGTTGQYAVVERQTSLVVAARATGIVGQHLSAAAGRGLVTKDRPGVAQAYVPNLHTTILMAYQPIAGTPYGVFVALPTKEAFAQANHVRDVLLIGLAVLAAAGAVIAGWTARGVGRRNRQLMHSVDDLQRKATRDSLTGVANRREVSESLALFLAATARGDLDTVGVAFIDLDGFKELNDRSGHVAADQLLRAIAGAMLATLRPSDVLGRFGGDEFVVIAPGLGSPRAAAALGDRLRHAVATTAVISEADEFVGPVTASVGVAIGSGTMTVEELMGAADSAMYQAKAAGGNRAFTATDSAGLSASS